MIAGKTVQLRSLELSDVDELLKGWNKMELRNLSGGAWLGPTSRGEEEEWIKATWKEKNERTRFVFAIETIKEKQLLGTICLFNCSWIDRSATLGVDIHNPKDRGKGYGSEAIRLLLDFAFKTLNLNRVELEVFDFNVRALECYRRVGFKEVGKKRNAKFIDSSYRDVIVMDILRDEWT